MKVPKMLLDIVGREYPRKNKYLDRLADLEAAGKKSEADKLRAEKDKDPHIIKLRAFREEEKKFLESLKKDVDSYISNLDEKDKNLIKWQRKLFEAGKKLTFYKDYISLDYDAEYEYRKAKVEYDRYPAIIKNYETTKKDYLWAQEEEKHINQKEEDAYQEELNKRTDELRKKKDNKIADLKKALSDGNISSKAFDNGKDIANKEFKYEREVFASRSPKQYNKELQQKLKHKLKYDTKADIVTLEEEISNVRRTTPIEIEKSERWKIWLGLPLPGLGQLLLGQIRMGLLFFLGTLLTFFVAIPYALGYGNYQGDGIAGLVHLAEGGMRTDRSLIFMIEGIIAILLLFVCLVMYVMSYKTVRKSVLGLEKGIRIKSWFETKDTMEKEGFPYFVNIPAYTMILFITCVPVITAILLSFTNMDQQHQSKFTWIGLKNYMTLFTGSGLQGSLFWSILGWTIMWTIGATTLAIAIGFTLALLSNNERVLGKRFFRTVYILPWAVPAFITIMFFSILLAPQGYLTNLISSLAARTVNVKESTILTRIALILIQGWCGSAYVFLLSTGVLQSIPSDLYEAAEMDGASSWQRLTRITVPMVLFQTAPILVGQYTFNFNNYSIIELFNGGGPFNPLVYGNLAGSSDLLISYIYKLTMNNQLQALGAAISIIISIALIILAFLGYRRTQTFKNL